jgi:hypothetical protein
LAIQFLKMNFQKLFKVWPYLLIISVVLCFFWKVVIKKEVPLPGDFIVGVYYPWLDYKWGYSVGVPVKNPITADVVSLIYPEQIKAIELLKSGELPLWNKTILTGAPLFANLQAAPFSPTNFVYFLFDKLTAWSVQIILQHILAACFTYLLLRYWKVSKIGAVFGGVAFSFSGFNMIFSQWNGHTLAAAFLPLIILLEDKLLRSGKLVDGALLSLCLVLQLVSGYPQISLYTAIAMGGLWLTRFEKKRDFFVKTLKLGVFVLLGFGLSAFQLLPTSELWALSQRNFEPHPFEWAFLPWKKVITFLASDYFGNHATKNYWGPQDYTSNTAYCGVVAITLSFLAVLKGIRRKKEILFLGFLSIFSLILSFPTPVSLFLWEHNILGFQAASAHRATILFCFSMTVLAGFGFDELSKAKTKDLFKSFFIPFIILSGFGIVTFYLYWTTKNLPLPDFYQGIPRYYIGLRNLVLPFFVFFSSFVLCILLLKRKGLSKIIPPLLLFLMFFELMRFGWKFTPFSPRNLIFPTTPILDFLISQEKPFRVTGNKVIPVNMCSPYDLDSLEGYETIHPLRISQFLAALNSGIVGTNPTGRYGIVDNDTSHLLDLVNIKYYLVHKINTSGGPDPKGNLPEKYLDGKYIKVFEDKSVAVLTSKNVLPRAFMVFDWDVEKENERNLALLLDKNYPFAKKVILEEEIGLKKETLGVNSFKVKIISYGDNQVVIDVETNKAGVLFLSDAYFPGWRAYVDGKETKIFRADFAFRAVVVEKGAHTVVFDYHPASFYLGVKISLSIILGMILALVLKALGKLK